MLGGKVLRMQATHSATKVNGGIQLSAKPVALFGSQLAQPLRLSQSLATSELSVKGFAVYVVKGG